MLFQRSFVESIIENLKDQFFYIKILACFKALAPCSFPPSREAFRGFGNSEIERLASFYGEGKKNGFGEELDSLVQKFELQKEYQTFKRSGKIGV